MCSSSDSIHSVDTLSVALFTLSLKVSLINLYFLILHLQPVTKLWWLSIPLYVCLICIPSFYLHCCYLSSCIFLPLAFTLAESGLLSPDLLPGLFLNYRHNHGLAGQRPTSGVWQCMSPNEPSPNPWVVFEVLHKQKFICLRSFTQLSYMPAPPESPWPSPCMTFLLYLHIFETVRNFLS